MRYELGEDLKYLSHIYKVSYNTLKKIKARAEKNSDPWIKGSRTKVGYEKFTEEAERRKREIEEQINDKARQELEVIQTLTDKAYASGNINVDKDIEQAANIRITRVGRMLGLRREVENILSDKEKAEIEKIKIESELKKMDIELKKNELEIKKLELDLKNKEAEEYLK